MHEATANTQPMRKLTSRGQEDTDMPLNNEPQSRLFFALDCPAALRKTISQWRSSLDLRAGRPVPPANFHLTLLFLGAVNTSQIADICTIASNVKTPGKRLTVALDRLEVWRKSKVLALMSEDAPAELLRFSYALEQAMLPFGYGQEYKDFRPHLTLARDYLSPVPEAGTPPEFFLRADRFALYESHKGQYRMIAEWPLAQPS
jgi:2'-5' RNA ligase